MQDRDRISEWLLGILTVFTALLGTVCPGMLFAFFMPPWLAVPWVIACGSAGPVILWRLDRQLYGPRA